MRASRPSLVILLLSAITAAGCCKSKTNENAPPSTNTPTQPATTVTTPVAPTPTLPPAPVEPYKVGERIQVEWKGDCYPARIVKVVRPGAYFITYEGYDHSWDETITKGRICSPKR